MTRATQYSCRPYCPEGTRTRSTQHLQWIPILGGDGLHVLFEHLEVVAVPLVHGEEPFLAAPGEFAQLEGHLDEIAVRIFLPIVRDGCHRLDLRWVAIREPFEAEVLQDRVRRAVG